MGTRVRTIALAAVLTAVAACGGEAAEDTAAPDATTTTAGSVTTTAAPTTTTTVAPTTTSTTTTTLAPPPPISFGEPVVVDKAERLDDFGGGAGDVLGKTVEGSLGGEAGALLLGSIEVAGPWVARGGVETRDDYLDTAAWWNTGQGWSATDPPPREGRYDEVAVAAVRHGDGIVAVGSNRDSGVTWEEVDGINYQVTDPWRATFWYLPDGGGWSFVEIEDPDGKDLEVAGVASGGPGLVAVGSVRTPGMPFSDVDAAVWVAETPSAWERLPDPDERFGGAGTQTIDAVVSFDGRLFAIGRDARGAGWPTQMQVWTSADGRVWEEAEPSPAFGASGHVMPKAAVATAGGIVVVGDVLVDDGRVPTIWFSADGEAWEQAAVPDIGFGELHDVAAFPGGLLAVGQGQDPIAPIALASADGRRWETVETGPDTGGDEAALKTVTVGAGEVWVAGWVGPWNARGVMAWQVSIG